MQGEGYYRVNCYGVRYIGRMLRMWVTGVIYGMHAFEVWRCMFGASLGACSYGVGCQY